jgi:hypothetical protein
MLLTHDFLITLKKECEEDEVLVEADSIEALDQAVLARSRANSAYLNEGNHMTEYVISGVIEEDINEGEVSS